MRKLRSIVQIVLLVLCVAGLSAAPSQLQDFRMAAQIEHFDITCPPEFDGQAAIIGRRAENAYQRVAASLQHDLSFRPLLVLFATKADQMRAIETRTVPGNREHVLVALDIPDAGLDGNLVHELSHVFLFDVLPPARQWNVPVWILEGLAEHQRGEWDADAIGMLRNMVETGTLPMLFGVDAAGGDSRRSAVFGHAAFDFLASRAGADGARRFFTNLRANPGTSPQNAYLATLALPEADFDRAFGEYLKRRF
jgi:hypothetical protein